MKTRSPVPRVCLSQRRLFIFCQSCGYKRRLVDPTETPARIDLNLPDVDSRLSTLRQSQSLKPYQK